MMRKEDLTKHFKEEKTVLKANPAYINIFVLVLLFFSDSAAQVPLNGFARISEFKIQPGFNTLVSVDYNSDGYRDFLAFNPSTNNYLSILFEPRGKQLKSTQKYFQFPLSNLNPLGEDERGVRKFVYASRKNRSAGFASVSKTGTLKIISNIKFSAYPDFIASADIEKDNKHEIVVSGAAFSGLSILKQNRSRFSDNKIYENRLFSRAVFVDLDYDYYEDLAAVDVFSNSIKLFYNDRTGGFSEQREINLGFQITQFQTNDLNLDGFNDIIYTNNKQLEILLGDSVSTFKNKIIIKSPRAIDKFSVFDFNGDGYNDIAFLNVELGIISVVFAENSRKFFPPLDYIQRQGIVDVTAFVDRGGRKLCALNENGFIYLIEKTGAFGNEQSIAAGIKPGLIGAFNYLNDNSIDFFVVDESELKLKLFVSAGNNLADKVFSYQLSKYCANVIVEDSNPVEKIFFCYSKGHHQIEIFYVDLENGNFSKRILYADHPIIDLELTANKNRHGLAVNLLLNSKGDLYSQVFKFRDFRYLKSAPEKIAGKTESAVLSLSELNEIYFQTKYGQSLYLNKINFTSSEKETVNLSSFKIEDEKKYLAELYCLRGVSNNDVRIINLIGGETNSTLNVISRGNYNTIQLSGFRPSPGQLKYFRSNNNSIVSLYDSQKGILKRILLSTNYQGNFISDIFVSKTINSYIIAPVAGKKEILIHTDLYGDLINFKNIL